MDICEAFRTVRQTIGRRLGPTLKGFAVLLSSTSTVSTVSHNMERVPMSGESVGPYLIIWKEFLYRENQ